MPDTPTSALVVPSRIQRTMNTVSLTPQAEVSLPTGQLRRGSDPFPPRGGVLSTDTVAWPSTR